MPTYSIRCEECGYSTTFISKIDDRDNTPFHCNSQMKRLLDTPQIQAQTISGIIRCSDGSQHEGHVAFEKYMEKNGLNTLGSLEGEAERAKANIEKQQDETRRKTIEDIATNLGI